MSQTEKNSSQKVNKAVLYYALKAARNNNRRGTAKVKDRSEVNMTNKKAVRQKGTGGARHGARNANLFVGGGSCHGPRPRSYYEYLNKSFKVRGFQEVFKYLQQNGKIIAIDSYGFSKPSTKTAKDLLTRNKLSSAVVIVPESEVSARKSFQNLPHIKVIHENNINVYDLVRYEAVLLTNAFMNQIKERYAL